MDFNMGSATQTKKSIIFLYAEYETYSPPYNF